MDWAREADRLAALFLEWARESGRGRVVPTWPSSWDTRVEAAVWETTDGEYVAYVRPGLTDEIRASAWSAVLHATQERILGTSRFPWQEHVTGQHVFWIQNGSSQLGV